MNKAYTVQVIQSLTRKLCVMLRGRDEIKCSVQKSLFE